MGRVENFLILLYNRLITIKLGEMFMSKAKNNTNDILLKMLRERQIKQNIYYLTTDSGLFNFLKVLFYIFTVVCTIINLLFLLGEWGGLNANLANAGNLSDLQQTQVAQIKNGIYSVLIISVILLSSALFFKLKKPILYGLTSLFSGGILIMIFAGRLSDALGSGDYSSFIFKHLLPLGIFIICGVFAAIIHLRQNILDKKGCREISEKIYTKYSVMAENITEEQWQGILNEYSAETPKSKKRSVKHRLRKENAKENKSNYTKEV